MINYTFETEQTSVNALKVIVGKRYQYIFDVLESTIGYFTPDCATIDCEVWIGKDSGNIHIDVMHERKNVNLETRSIVRSNFVLGKRNYKTLCITHYTYNYYNGNALDDHIVYKDIEIPKKEKLTTVAYRYM